MKQINNFWFSAISLILLGASLFLNVSHTVITNESIVLVFVGILATFIVVGNYAQVTDIKIDTNTQIKDLESKTEKKINELNDIYKKLTETSEKIKIIEKNTEYNAAEAYCLYGAFCLDKELYQNSTQYLLDAVSLYNKSEPDLGQKKNCALLDIVVKNFEPAKWNKLNQKENYFDYQDYLRKVKELPDKYTQKQKIIDLLENYKNEEQENKK